MISLKEACIHHYNICVFEHHLCQATDCSLLAISSQQLREEFSQDHDGNWSKLFDTRTIKERDVWFQNYKITAQNITVSWLKYIQRAGTTPRHWKHHRSYCTFFCHKLKNHEAIASRGEVLERFNLLSNTLMAFWTQQFCHQHVMVIFLFSWPAFCCNTLHLSKLVVAKKSDFQKPAHAFGTILAWSQSSSGSNSLSLWYSYYGRSHMVKVEN